MEGTQATHTHKNKMSQSSFKKRKKKEARKKESFMCERKEMERRLMRVD
jgi:hypothetical protein